MTLLSNSSYTIARKITTVFLVYTMIITFLFSLTIFTIERASHNRAFDENVMNLSRLASNEVEKYVKDYVTLLEGYANVYKENKDPKETISILKGVQKTYNSSIRDFFLYKEDETYYNTLNVVNPARVEGIKKVLNGELEAYVGEAVLHPVFGEATFVVMVPIKEGEDVLGLIGANVVLDDLSGILSGYKMYNNGFSWLLNQKNEVIAYPIHKHILNLSLKGNEDFSFGNLDNIVKNSNGETVIGTYTDDTDVKNRVAFTLVEGTKNWHVAFSTNADNAMKHFLTLAYGLGIGLFIIIILAYITSHYFTRQLTEPINELITVVNMFNQGNKGVRAKVESNDEIGALSKSFNQMADTIIEHTDNVEELIQQRTSMLADLNYQIVIRNNELDTMNKELEDTNTRLHTLATTDMLTNLCNRHELIRNMQSELDNVNKGEQKSFSVLFVDLDNFKYYNDTFSHEIGDLVLIEVAKILRQSVREIDVVSRYGGDEFVIVLKQSDFDFSKQVAEKIHATILRKKGFKTEIAKKVNTDVVLLGKNQLSCSIGIVNYVPSMKITAADDLLTQADETMYKAKKQGKSKIVVS